MLTVFDGANGYPVANDDYYIRQLASGLDEIVFNVSIRDPIYKYIVEEAKVRDRDQNFYLIKQIDAGDDSAKVVAQIDIDDFKRAMYEKYTNNSATVYNTVLGVLPTGWSCIDHSGVIIRRTIPTSDTTTDYNVTAWEVLQACCNTYKVRFRFDNVNKIVTIVNPASYENMGAFATRDLNLKALNYKGKSNDFITRLYAEGADGLTFADINGGKNYVDNNTYSDKIISTYWKDERYTDAQSLLEDATAKLAEMAQPTRSYDCDVLDLASTNPDMYGFEDFALFNVITLIDDAQERRLNYQIVEKWIYPYYPVNNKVVLNSETPKIQTQVATLIDAINSPVSAFQQIIQSAIANSTALITGNKGGYVVLHDSNGDGVPDEILIMDTPDIATATKVWRWNENGLGYSNTGYNGTFGLAMTIDGAIVADYITAGTLNGAVVRAGTIEANALSVNAQKEFNLVHNYLPYDIFSNIARWENEYPLTVPNPQFVTIDGETYLEVDGTQLSSYSSAYEIKVDSDVLGKPKMHIKLVCRFDRQYTPQEYQYIVRYHFKATDGYNYGAYTTAWLEKNRTYEANTDYTIEVNETPSYLISGNAYYTIVFQPQVKMYIKVFEVTSSENVYNNASMSITENGLSATVQRGNVISCINQSAEQVEISASKINLTGDLSLRGDFTSYKPNDDTTKVFLDSGNLTFYNAGAEVFSIAASALYGNYAGIFFGDPDDGQTWGRYTTINQEMVIAPTLYARKDGTHQPAGGFGGDALIEGSLAVYGASNFYSNVYNSGGGVVFVSDRRKKRSIKDLAIKKAKSFIMGLKPREFKFTKDISTSDRKHHGFIAQEVKEAMGEDWGLYIEDAEQDFIGLRYDEIIADLVKVVQDQEKRIETLERKLKNDKSNN